MRSLILRVNTWWNARQTSESERLLCVQVEQLRAELAMTREKLDAEQRINRIHERERDEFAAVMARNLERVRAETRLLSGGEGAKIAVTETSG